ncbi:MAG: transporter ATP-binding protein [Marmoricola sp.]|nr:transporter ATP-binding protein [Marmoricola sp.]
MSRRPGYRLGWSWVRSSWRLPTTWASVIGVAVAVLVALTAVALWHGNDDRFERGAGQEPRHASGARSTFTAQLRSVPYDGDVFTTVLVSRTTADAPAPPGLARFPEPGEAWISPALSAAMRTRPALARSLPGRVVGIIGERGLQSPDQLYAVVGLGPGANPGATRATGWGNMRPTNDRSRLPAAPFLGVLALMVALPLLVFGRAIADLTADSRRLRVASLHLLGVPVTVLARAVAWDTAVKASVGALIGTAAFLASVRAEARCGVLGITWYPPPTLVPVASGLLAVLGVLVVVVIAARRSVVLGLRDPLQARAGRPPARPHWHRIPLLLGLGLLFGIVGRQAATGQGGSSGTAIWFFYAGTVLALAGAALALPDLVGAAGLLIPSRTRWPWLLVAKRRLAAAPERTARASAAVLVVVSVGLLGTAAVDDVSALDSASGWGVQLSVTLSGTASPTAQRALLSAPTRAAVLLIPGDLGGRAIGTCGALAAIARQASPRTARALSARCRDGGSYTLLDPTDQRPQPVAAGSQPLELPELVTTALPAGRVDARAPASIHRVGRGATLLAYVAPVRSDDFVASVLGHDPLAAVVETGSSTYHAVVPAVTGVLRSGLALGLLVGLATLLLTFVDARRRSAAQAAVQRALGASRRHLALSEVAEHAIGALAVLLTALVTGTLVGSAYLVVGATGAVLGAQVLVAAGWALGMLLAMTGLVLMIAFRRAEPDATLLRRE